MKSVPPEFKKKVFTCPHCKVCATHRWEILGQRHSTPTEEITFSLRDEGIWSKAEGELWISICVNCKNFILWWVTNSAVLDYAKQEAEIIYPASVNIVPPPHPDMPEEVKSDYEEAAKIVNFSPRGAAALLRLAVQKLVKFLGEDERNLNRAIGNLVKKGLPEDIQKALDIVRVIGNEAVHPGQIDIKDNRNIALTLFEIINFIVERMITQPKKIDEFFERLPESKKEQIKKRNNKS